MTTTNNTATATFEQLVANNEYTELAMNHSQEYAEYIFLAENSEEILDEIRLANEGLECDFVYMFLDQFECPF